MTLLSQDLALILAVPVGLLGARFGAAAGAGAGLAAGAVQGAAWLSQNPGAAPVPAAGAAAALVLLGGLVGQVAARESARRLSVARGVWTGLRGGQVSEFLSYVLYQLREYQISATSLVEALALSAPKDNPAFTERLERLRRVVAELNGKAARLLGENSAATTQGGRPAEVALAEVARRAAADAQIAFATAPVSVSVVEKGESPKITCDPRALRLSLLAVMQNALEACSARGGGTLSVVVRRRDRYAEIELVDDGGGLSADAGTLFEPFYAARAGSGGLGLGLPMARRMIERLGGTVRVKSQGGATAALIELPITRDLPFVRNEESTWAGRRQGV
jgi:signal transduction histidine kinase